MSKRIGIVALAVFVAAQAASGQDYPTHEAATRYLGNHPGRVEVPWSDLMQGLASDRQSFWFVTQQKKIWRIPVWVDLARDPSPGSVTSRGLEPAAAGYDHFGDPDHWPVGGRGYLLVPLELDAPNEPQYEAFCGSLAVFRADEPGMPYVTRECLPGQGRKAPWLAVGPDGILYSSRFDVLRAQDEAPEQPTGINRYQVNWSTLSGSQPELVLTPLPPLKPFDAAGNPMSLANVQGGVLSPSGRLLFLSSDELGVLVFRIDADRLVLLERSCNAAPSASCRFSFQWENDQNLAFDEEPEGLEYWDLNDGRAPGVRGELHVGMIDVESQDDLFIKHYTAIQWVDAAAPAGGDGKIGSPYQSLTAAMPASWPGSIVRVRGHQPLAAGTRLVSTGVLIEAWDGPAVLGD